MRTIPYTAKEKNTGSTQTHVATDTRMGNASYDTQRMEEGFAASDGVRAGTTESGGRVKHPESSDASFPDRTPPSIKKENPGLAD